MKVVKGVPLRMATGAKPLSLGRRRFPSHLKFLLPLPAIVLATIGIIAALNPKTDTTAAPVSAPTVSSITPDNGPIAGGTVITVTGTNFKGEYERVEALIFDGSAYIDTDISPYNSYINARFEMDLSDTSTLNMVFGSTAASTTGLAGFGKLAGSGGKYLIYRNGTTSDSGNTFVKANQRNDVTLDPGSGAHVNGSTVAASSNIAAGSTIRVGGSATPESFYRGKLYALRLFDSSNVLSHNLVPVKKISDGSYGLVDRETGIFYGNSAGSGSISGGTTIDDVFTVGAAIPGGLSPDNPLKVLIDNRPCTGVDIVSNTELTCHTPSGLTLGKKDVSIINGDGDEANVTDGFEYALRLNSIFPKYGDPAGGEVIEIEGGVFSTPPDSYISVDGLIFDGRSWIETGFNQLGDTKTIITLKYGDTLPSSGHMGLYGTRNSGSGDSNVIWAGVNMSTMRSDYGGSSSQNANATLAKLGLTTTPRVVQTLVKDNGNTTLSPGGTQTVVNSHGTTPLPLTGIGIPMLLGSLSHGGAYGTNGATTYSSFVGTIYSTQICKALNAIPAGTVHQRDDDTCGSNRVLVRDLRPSRRSTDGAYGFYDMVTGEFIENAGYGTFAPESESTENDLEVPVELDVTFSYDGGPDLACANPELISPTRIRCTTPESPFSTNDGKGKVDVTVFANGVQATPGSVDANDYYYGTPMVVDSIAPNRGPISGGQVVTIAGNNFYPDDNPTEHDPLDSWEDISIFIGDYSDDSGQADFYSMSLVDLAANGSECTIGSVSDYTNTAITCTTGANPGGISDILVDNGRERYIYGGSIDPITGAITSGYLYEDDLISINPSEGPTTGGTLVTITGNNFLTVDTTTQVFFGGVLATNISVVDSNTITARTPPHAPEVVNVLVSQDGYAASFSRSLEDGFEYTIGQSNISLSPNRGYLSGGDTITISGAFDTNTTATVSFGGTASPSVTVLNATTLEVVTPARATTGRVNIIVQQYGTTVGIAANGFTYINPLTIDSISPDRGSTGGGTLVTISGQSFIPAGSTAAASVGNLSISLGGSPCTVDTDSLSTDYTDTTIRCTTSAHTNGIVDVVVSTALDSNHSDTLPGIFDSTSGTVTSGYLYIETDLSLSVEAVGISLPAPNTLGAGSTAISVTTNNPTGYSLSIRADDQNALTDDDSSLSCATPGLENSKFTPLSLAGSLSAGTWGWGVGGNQPSTWNPISSTDTALTTPASHPSGPSEDGTAPDSYTLWFGANASWSLPPCAYTGRVIITMVPLR